MYLQTLLDLQLKYQAPSKKGGSGGDSGGDGFDDVDGGGDGDGDDPDEPEGECTSRLLANPAIPACVGHKYRCMPNSYLPNYPPSMIWFGINV